MSSCRSPALFFSLTVQAWRKVTVCQFTCPWWWSWWWPCWPVLGLERFTLLWSVLCHLRRISSVFPWNLAGVLHCPISFFKKEHVKTKYLYMFCKVWSLSDFFFFLFSTFWLFAKNDLALYQKLNIKEKCFVQHLYLFTFLCSQPSLLVSPPSRCVRGSWTLSAVFL